MLTALKVSPEVNSQWPRFCAHIDFEFLSNDKNEKFVRVLYDENPITIGGNYFLACSMSHSALVELYVTNWYTLGATNPIIPLEEFNKLTEWVQMNPKDFQEASNMDDSDWSPQFNSKDVERYVGGEGAAVSLNWNQY